MNLQGTDTGRFQCRVPNKPNVPKEKCEMMNELYVLVSGDVKVGKSSVAHLIGNVLSQHGIQVTVADDDLQHVMTEGRIEEGLRVISDKTRVFVRTQTEWEVQVRDLAEEELISIDPVYGLLPKDFEGAFRKALSDPKLFPPLLSEGMRKLAKDDSSSTQALFEALAFAAQRLLRERNEYEQIHHC